MENFLVCKGLSKKYKGSSYALRNVSFGVPAKGIFALIGRNGAGKTTLVRILATELMQTSGSASLNGFDTVKDAGAIREFIAIVPQESRLLGFMTPRQNIISYLMYRGFGHGEAKRRAAQALKRSGINGFADTQSMNLSGGTKRKALLATVMASEAGVLFLDEPTTGLDPISRADVWRQLGELKKDRFIFLTTHYLEEAEHLADTIGIVEKGRLVAIGSMEQLRKSVGYDYTVKILQKGARIGRYRGKTVRGLDGNVSIFTTNREANRLSNALVKRNVRVSTTPISLEEIFYHKVRRSLAEDTEGEEKEWW